MRTVAVGEVDEGLLIGVLALTFTLAVAFIDGVPDQEDQEAKADEQKEELGHELELLVAEELANFL